MKRKKFPEEGYTEYHSEIEAYLKKKIPAYKQGTSYQGYTYLAWSPSSFWGCKSYSAQPYIKQEDVLKTLRPTKIEFLFEN